MKKLVSVVLTLLIIMGAVSCCFASLAAEDGKWIGTWSTSPVDYYISLEDYLAGVRINGDLPAGTTTRTLLTVSAPGTKLRLKFSNIYGETEETINEVTVARTDKESEASIHTSTLKTLTFNGSRKVTIPAGGYVWCDEFDMDVKALDKLSISMFFASNTHIKTAGLFGGTTFMTFGGVSLAESRRLPVRSDVTIAAGTNVYYIIPFLTNIDVYSPDANAYSTVLLGDSTLVNNFGQYLSQRLVEAGAENIGMLNQAIMGNRLFYKGAGLIGNLYGDPVSERFERDVLEQTGVKKVFVKIGVNDILHPSSKSMHEDAPYVSTDDIIEGYRKLIAKAHDNGIEIYFMEITPWNGYVRDILGNKNDISWSEDLQKMCDTVNEWIRTNQEADGYIGSSCLAMENDCTRFKAIYTRDGIHFSNIGAKKFADCVSLSFFGCDDNQSNDMLSAPASDDSTQKSNFLVNLDNAFVFIRQLFSSLRIEFMPFVSFVQRLFS